MKTNELHTCIDNPADADLLVYQMTDNGPWYVHSMGHVFRHGYWILFERDD